MYDLIPSSSVDNFMTALRSQRNSLKEIFMSLGSDRGSHRSTLGRSLKKIRKLLVSALIGSF